jgi:Fe-S cluster assembly scaffold protein SufB
MASAVPRYAEWVDPATVASLSRDLGDPPGVRRAREAALQAFRDLPLEPNPLYRKYGYFAGVDLAGLAPALHASPVPLPPAPADTIRVVHDASGTRVELPPELASTGVSLERIDQLWPQGEEAAQRFLDRPDSTEDRLSALAAALVNRGYRLSVPDRMPGPLRLQDITVLSAPHEALSVHRSIHVGRESRLLASEEVYSAPGHDHQRLVGSSVSLDLDDGSQAAYLTLHAPDPAAIGLYARRATVGRSARLGWVLAGFGGFRTRARNLSVLAGQGSDVEDLQAFYGAGQQAYDSAVQITHTGTDTHGQSITRGVFQDEARGMSRGLVRIEKEARKTISFLSEHAMLLSRGARSDTIPVLEILCRDVKATHSSSVAPVDPEKVFYLESRGVPPREAIRMISEGFLSHVLARAPIANLGDRVYPLLAARWAGRDRPWAGPEFPALPRLDFAADVPETDWRFDAKLR